MTTQHAWIATAPQPWIVVDLCALEALASDKRLEGAFSIVLPHRMFLEVVTSTRPHKLLGKLERIVADEKMRGRVLIGRDVMDVVNSQVRPQDVSVEMRHVIDEETSEAVSLAQRSGKVLDLDGLDDAARTITSDDDAKERFNRLSVEYAKWARLERAEMATQVGREFQSKTPRWEHVPRVADTARAFNQRFSNSEWQAELQQDPSRSAIARFLQIYAWYMNLRLARSDTSDTRFGNNFDDLHYVFLASYTGHLRTDDKLMTTAAVSLFGSFVHVHAGWDEYRGLSANEQDVE